MYPLHAINLNMLQLQGRSDLFLYLEVAKKIIGVIPILVGVLVNVYSMLLVNVFTGFIAFLLNSFFTGKKLGYSSWMQLKDVSASYAVSFIVAGSMYFFKYLPVSYWIVLPLQILVGFAVCLFVCEQVRLAEYLEIKRMAVNVFNRLRKRTE